MPEGGWTNVLDRSGRPWSRAGPAGFRWPGESPSTRAGRSRSIVRRDPPGGSIDPSRWSGWATRAAPAAGVGGSPNPTTPAPSREVRSAMIWRPDLLRTRSAGRVSGPDAPPRLASVSHRRPLTSRSHTLPIGCRPRSGPGRARVRPTGRPRPPTRDRSRLRVAAGRRRESASGSAPGRPRPARQVRARPADARRGGRTRSGWSPSVASL